MLVLSLCLFGVACGDDDGDSTTPDGAPAPDAPEAPAPDAMPQPDAGPLDRSKCPAAYGPAAVVNTLMIAEDEMDAFDLDGDGTGDNSLSQVAGAVNPGLQDDLADGSFRAMSELRMLDDPLLVNDSSVTFVSYVPVDTDSPRNPNDDFSGMEPFYFHHGSVAPETCEPYAKLPATLAGGRVTGNAPVIRIPLGPFGIADFGKPHLDVQVAPGAAGVGYEVSQGRLGGAIPTCPLNTSESPIAGKPNLWALVQVFNLQPDIDLDGDGAEEIRSDSLGIYECVDGDGTVIAGELCGCDPRIADGYSVLFKLTGVGAELLGPAPTP